MSSDPVETTNAAPATLDGLLLALQKTLSRVSRDSASVPADQARALIVGPVSFDLSVRCRFAQPDELVLDSQDGWPLRLSGQISPDVGVSVPGASPS